MALTPSDLRRRKMNLLMAMSYAAFASSKASAWSPTLLFAAGEQGAWYDPSDFTTMFQDSAGTTPVTAVEQPVGLLLDKSKGLALGAELVTNGGFDSDTGWTKGIGWTISGGTANYSTPGSPNLLTQANVFTVDKWYLVSGYVSNLSAGSVNVYSGTSTTIPTSNFNVDANGAFSGRILATSTTLALRGSLAGVFSIDNISVRELPGNHASQSTSASRPVLSARVNQLLATATLATQNVTTLAATYTLAFSGTGTVTATGTNIGVYSAGSNSLVCTAGTLTLTVVGSVTLADLRVTNDGVGLPVYQAVVTSTDYDTSGFPLYLKFDGVDDSLVTGTIDPGAVDKAQVFAGVRKLSDDIDRCLVEIGANANTTNGSFALFAPAKIGGSNIGKYLGALRGTAASLVELTTYTAPTTNTLAAQYDIAGASIASESIYRVNGSAPTETTNGIQAGTGNFGSLPLNIGRRNNATLPLNANLYSLILRFSAANLSDAQIASTETYVNNLTKAY